MLTTDVRITNAHISSYILTHCSFLIRLPLATLTPLAFDLYIEPSHLLTLLFQSTIEVYKSYIYLYYILTTFSALPRHWKIVLFIINEVLSKLHHPRSQGLYCWTCIVTKSTLWSINTSMIVKSSFKCFHSVFNQVWMGGTFIKSDKANLNRASYVLVFQLSEDLEQPLSFFYWIKSL